ncbi:hypothetical protein K8R47_00535 [archaeon]|nr:hypothetical protein [archaeon]
MTDYQNFKKDYFSSSEKGYHMMHSMMGIPLSPQTANQLQEATTRLNAGVKNIELSALNPETMEAIPKQHFEEIRRLSQLTDTKASLHAPVFDLGGFGKEGWSERERQQVEDQMENVIDRARDMRKDGNTIINVHSSGGVPAYEWQKEKYKDEEKLPDEGKRMIVAIDQSSGKLVPIKYEEKDYVGRKKVWEPKERLINQNQTMWDEQKLRFLNFQKEKAEIQDRIMHTEQQLRPLMQGYQKGVLTPQEQEELRRKGQEAKMFNDHLGEIDQHLGSGLNEMHHLLNYVPEDDKKKMEKFKKEFTQNYKTYEAKIRDIIEEGKEEKDQRKLNQIRGQMDDLQNQQMKELQHNLNLIGDPKVPKNEHISAPEVLKPVDEFAIEKTSETVANSAMYAYDKYKNKSPVISIENVMPDWTIGRAESLREAVKESREKFAKQLVEKKNMNIQEARRTAEKFIGATWDVGHINMLKKFGYKDEDIVKETEKISPYLKHLHVTDNFGFNDTHLAPGMGNVPIKKMLAEVKKKVGEENYEKMAAIVEAGNFAAQFKTSPHLPTLDYFNSPLYENKAGPYWEGISETYGAYNSGYNLMFPEKHHEMYGSGFSNLPQEVGGQVTGDRSRFAGTPNQ